MTAVRIVKTAKRIAIRLVRLSDAAAVFAATAVAVAVVMVSAPLDLGLKAALIEHQRQLARHLRDDFSNDRENQETEG